MLARFEFRYRYMPDFYEISQIHDVFAIRIDSPGIAILDANPAVKPAGGWLSKSYKLATPLAPGSHALYLFFKTGDGQFNNGAGVAFDPFRTCSQ